MEQAMMIEEIERQFDSEWVLLDEPIFDDSSRLLAGRVIGHSPNQDRVEAMVKRLRPGTFTVLNLVDAPTIITRLMVGFIEADSAG